MKIEELFKNHNETLEEGITDIVFHGTPKRKAVSIFDQDAFKLSSADQGLGLAPPGKGGNFTEKEKLRDMGVNVEKFQYYMSTTRSRRNDAFRDMGMNVIIALDGRKLSQNFKGIPIDFFSGGSAYNTDEMEDRILSRKPVINNFSNYIIRVDFHKHPSSVISENEVDLYGQDMDILRSLNEMNIPGRIYSELRDLYSNTNSGYWTVEEVVDLLKNQ